MIHEQSVKCFAGMFGEVLQCKINIISWFKVSIPINRPLFLAFFYRVYLSPILIHAQIENIGLLCFGCGCLGYGHVKYTSLGVTLVDKEGFKAVPMFGDWLSEGSNVDHVSLGVIDTCLGIF